MEVVEKVCFSENCNFCLTSQTILSAKRHDFSDVCESDILIKTLSHERYFPDFGVKYEEDKIFIVLDDFFLETYLSVPPSIST